MTSCFLSWTIQSLIHSLLRLHCCFKSYLSFSCPFLKTQNMKPKYILNPTLSSFLSCSGLPPLPSAMKWPLLGHLSASVFSPNASSTSPDLSELSSHPLCVTGSLTLPFLSHQLSLYFDGRRLFLSAWHSSEWTLALRASHQMTGCQSSFHCLLPLFLLQSKSQIHPKWSAYNVHS